MEQYKELIHHILSIKIFMVISKGRWSTFLQCHSTLKQLSTKFNNQETFSTLTPEAIKQVDTEC